MAICIYCLRDSSETTFTTREHLIPQFMGTFYNGSPKKELLFNIEDVCTTCNNEVLSKLENTFRNDSLEGFLITAYNLPFHSTRASSRMNHQRFKYTISSSLFSSLRTQHLQKIFPRILESGNVAYEPVFGLIHQKSKSYHWFWLEEFKSKYTSNSGRKAFIKDLKSYEKKGIIILYHTPEVKNEIINLLASFNIIFQEKETEPLPNFNKEDRLQIKIEDSMDYNTLRFPAKLAYNYFAYCMLHCKFRDQLLSKNFQNIRDFILGKDKNPDSYIQLSVPILHDEHINKIGRPFYQVAFESDGTYIYGRVSLLGVKHYRILLGVYPFSIHISQFGNGHNFDPLLKEATRLTTGPIPKIIFNQFSIFNGSNLIPQ